MREPIVSSETNRRELLKLSGMGLLGGTAVTALTPARAQAVAAEPNISYSSWVQGYIMQVQNPEQLDQDSRIGWCAVVGGKPGTENWFHFAIPTPVIVNDVRLQADSIMLRFDTGSVDAWVRQVDIWDGWNKIWTSFDSTPNLNWSGQHWFERVTVPGTPAMGFGMGISVGVSFGVEAMDHGMKFYGVGCDFVIRPSA
jgi:hypothetical protein